MSGSQVFPWLEKFVVKTLGPESAELNDELKTIQRQRPVQIESTTKPTAERPFLSAVVSDGQFYIDCEFTDQCATDKFGDKIDVTDFRGAIVDLTDAHICIEPTFRSVRLVAADFEYIYAMAVSLRLDRSTPHVKISNSAAVQRGIQKYRRVFRMDFPRQRPDVDSTQKPAMGSLHSAQDMYATMDSSMGGASPVAGLSDDGGDDWVRAFVGGSSLLQMAKEEICHLLTEKAVESAAESGKRKRRKGRKRKASLSAAQRRDIVELWHGNERQWRRSLSARSSVAALSCGELSQSAESRLSGGRRKSLPQMIDCMSVVRKTTEQLEERRGVSEPPRMGAIGTVVESELRQEFVDRIGESEVMTEKENDGENEGSAVAADVEMRDSSSDRREKRTKGSGEMDAIPSDFVISVPSFSSEKQMGSEPMVGSMAADASLADSLPIVASQQYVVEESAVASSKGPKADATSDRHSPAIERGDSHSIASVVESVDTVKTSDSLRIGQSAAEEKHSERGSAALTAPCVSQTLIRDTGAEQNRSEHLVGDLTVEHLLRLRFELSQMPQ